MPLLVPLIGPRGHPECVHESACVTGSQASQYTAAASAGPSMRNGDDSAPRTAPSHLKNSEFPRPCETCRGNLAENLVRSTVTFTFLLGHLSLLLCCVPHVCDTPSGLGPLWDAPGNLWGLHIRPAFAI